jgi:hypothetical protein
MNDNLTDITMLLDDVIGGFNEFVRRQQDAEGDCVLSLVQFDSTDPYEVIHQTVPIDRVPELNPETYSPRSRTPLLDALGRTITRTGERLAKMAEPDRPGSVIFVVITDGLENASREYSRKQVFEMIREQREVYNWQFVFLAAEQDAIGEAHGYGFDADHAVRWGKTGEGLRAVMAVSSGKVARYRQWKRSADLNWTEAERRQQEDEIARGG